jgi:hypothetical protein
MAELRVDHGGLLPQGAAPIGADQRRQGGGRREQPSARGRARPGAEELAVALDARRQLSAHFEQDAEGQPLVRITDRERGETVALLTPEELRTLAEQTGLPSGMLVYISS